ncbi:hypothetical protein DJ73_10950 [Halorubrum sp. Ea1]|nr:hypothetical protein DJ73_10950 [Halorubrum sp. Ea1]
MDGDCVDGDDVDDDVDGDEEDGTATRKERTEAATAGGDDVDTSLPASPSYATTNWFQTPATRNQRA